MIERCEVNGKPATVAYLVHDPNGGFRSVSAEECEMVEVRFEDGAVLFGRCDRNVPEDEQRYDDGAALGKLSNCSSKEGTE